MRCQLQWILTLILSVWVGAVSCALADEAKWTKYMQAGEEAYSRAMTGSSAVIDESISAKQARFADAETAYSSALVEAESTRLHGSQLARTLDSLARTYWQEGKREDSDRLYKRVRAINNRLLLQAAVVIFVGAIIVATAYRLAPLRLKASACVLGMIIIAIGITLSFDANKSAHYSGPRVNGMANLGILLGTIYDTIRASGLGAGLGIAIASGIKRESRSLRIAGAFVAVGLLAPPAIDWVLMRLEMSTGESTNPLQLDVFPVIFHPNPDLDFD